MNQIQPGRWAIQSIMVNSTTVMNFDGFDYLEFGTQEMSIEPIGFQFKVQQSNGGNTILKSRGQVYFVDVAVDRNQLKMKMTRNEVSEVLEISAELQESLDPVS